MAAMFAKGSGLNEQSLQIYREPAIYASYQVRFIWPSGVRVDEYFRNRPITLKSNYGSEFLTQNYELQFSFNVIITITYSTL